MAIPVQNVYYLLSYVWGDFKGADLIDVESLQTTEQVDLFAKVLIDGTNHLFRRGLAKGYRTYDRQIAGVRGQINFDASLKKMLFQQGKARCRVDAFTVDVLHNQLLKATMVNLLRAPKLDRELRSQLRELVRHLRGVSDLPRLRPNLFRQVRLHRNNQYYRFLLHVCELIVQNLLVNESTGEMRFRDILRDETTMSALFERFVRNFYEREHPTFRVRSDQLSWGGTAVDPEHLDYLPKMITDITLRSPDRVIIIDTKFYRSTLQHYRKSGGTVHSKNLYQLYSYLRSFQRSETQRREVEGMLLYPVVDRQLRLDYEIDGFRVQICTVDLSRNWRDIEAELLSLVAPAFPSEESVEKTVSSALT